VAGVLSEIATDSSAIKNKERPAYELEKTKKSGQKIEISFDEQVDAVAKEVGQRETRCPRTTSWPVV